MAENAAPGEKIEYKEALADLSFISEFEVNPASLGPRSWNFQDEDAARIFQRLIAAGQPLESFVDRFTAGVQSGSDRILTLTLQQSRNLGIESEVMRPIMRGRDVRAYSLNPDTKLLIFPYKDAGDEFEILSEGELAQYPNAWRYLNQHRSALAARVWFGKMRPSFPGSGMG